MRILWEDRAWDEYLYWQSQDKKNAQTDKCIDKGYPAKYLRRNW